MRQHSIKKDKEFMDKAMDMLWKFGAKEVEEGRMFRKEFKLEVPGIGIFKFPFFEPDKGSVFSVFCRLIDEQRPTKEVAALAKAKFGFGLHDVMNPFSGKFNIHEWTAQEALNELEERLQWMVEQKTEEEQ
jgi:hypothetical protein